jgi:hypothetical protein
VSLHRLLAESEPRGDLAAGHSLSDEPEDLDLPGAEPGQRLPHLHGALHGFRRLPRGVVWNDLFDAGADPARRPVLVAWSRHHDDRNGWPDRPNGCQDGRQTEMGVGRREDHVRPEAPQE